MVERSSIVPGRPELDVSNALAESSAVVQGLVRQKPVVGVVLGSGLGAFAESIEARSVVPYADIPHMPRSSVEGHAGNLVFGGVAETAIACLEGRVHAYEGHSPERVVYGVRLLAALGCRAVILTNAAGGIREGLAPGDPMLIVDHLNLSGQNPLVGPNLDQLGPRFPDLTRAYDERMTAAARLAARAESIELKEGVYAGMLGPSYETPAEIRMLRALGADAVGMSTVAEVIALRHLGVRVGAMSLITNLAAGLSGALLDHAEVQEVARRSGLVFVRLLRRWIAGLAAEVSA
jgi:purine-nucleoside phosphorylase